MKYSHIFLALFCILFLLTGCTKVKREYHNNGKIKSETTYRFGKETGTTTHYHNWYPTKTMEIQMKRGKKNGKLIKRFFDNTTELIAYYKNDLLEGVETHYYMNGNISLQTHYSKGLKNGPVTSWFSNGIVRESGSFANDMFDGEWIHHDERGFIVGEGSFVKGTGKRLSYDELGRLQCETYFVDNKKEGLETHFLPSGEVEKIILFKEDRIIEINGTSIEDL